MTAGEKAYERFVASCLEDNCTVDPWEELSDMDKRAWQHAAQIGEERLRVLMDLSMCSDPWPLSHAARDLIDDWLNEQAFALGFDGWIDAYHRLEPKEVK